jgi:hypothetical protein
MSRSDEDLAILTRIPLLLGLFASILPRKNFYRLAYSVETFEVNVAQKIPTRWS